jgi:hypothetical protein
MLPAKIKEKHVDENDDPDQECSFRSQDLIFHGNFMGSGVKISIVQFRSADQKGRPINSSSVLCRGGDLRFFAHIHIMVKRAN